MTTYSNLKTLRIQSLRSMPQLYFWGKPISQQLYQQHQIAIPPIHLETQITQIACGENHCIILTDEAVLGLGDNAQRQLGNGIPYLNGLGIFKISLSIQHKIVSVACGSHHTLLLDQIGNVYSSGKGDNGELGRGRVRCNSSFDIVISNAKQISAGKDHSLALCGSKVFGWGNSNDGQLGLLITKNYFNPQQLNIYPCTLVYAGPKYSIFVTIKGVYSSGVNNHCQLGLGHDTNIQVPRRMSIQQPIVKLQGSHYCVAGTDKDEWYMWGKGPMGLFKFPTKMSFLKGAQQISFGVNFGTILRDEKVFVWGSNLWGQLGVAENFRGYPQQAQQLSSLKLNSISCGGSFMLAFSNSKFTNQDYINQGSVIEKQQTSEQCNNNFEDKCQLQQIPRRVQKNQAQQNKIKLFKQLKKRLYTQQQNNSQKINLRKNQTHSATVSHIFYEAKPKQTKTKSKFVKLCDLKNKSCDQNLQKQNSNLKEMLQFQRYQAIRLKQTYTKKLNKMYKQTLQHKMSHFQNKLNKNNTLKNKSNPLESHASASSKHSKQHPQISFRSKPIQQDKIQKMGIKISQLKSILENACT